MQSNDNTSGRKPSLVINTMSNWAVLGVSTMVAFVLTPYLIHSLGDNDYGIWVVLGSVVSMYGLLEMGIGSAVIRYTAFYIGKKDNESVNSTFNSSFMIFCGIGLLCISISFLLVRPLADFFDVKENNFVSFQHGIWFLGIATAISFPSNVLRATVVAHEHFLPVNAAAAAIEVLRFCFSMTAIKLGFGLQGVAFATLMVTIVTLFSNTVFYNIFCPALKLRPTLATLPAMHELFIYAIPAAVTVLADFLRMRVGNIIIAKYLDMSAATIYSVGATLTYLLIRLLVATSSALDPRFSRLKGLNNDMAINRLYLRALAFSTSLAFSVGLTLILVGQAFITRWIGTGYNSSYTVLVILIVGNMFAASQMPTVSLLFALNRHQFCGVLVLFEGIANCALSIFLIRYFGLTGVAIGTLIPMFICKIMILPWYAGKQVNIRASAVFSAIGRPILVLSAAGLTALYFFQPTALSWFQIFVVSGFCVTAMMALANWVGQSRKYRIGIKDVTRWLSPRFTASAE